MTKHWLLAQLPYLIPLVAPMLVGGLKRWLTKVPPMWYPVLATALGPLLDSLLQVALSVGVGPAYATLLGAAGVAVREIVDQALKASGVRAP